MSGPVVCARCSAVMRNRFDQVELRTELRSVATLRRLRTWRTAFVCQSCAQAIAYEHDHGGTDATETQGTLW